MNAVFEDTGQAPQRWVATWQSYLEESDLMALPDRNRPIGASILDSGVALLPESINC